VGVGHHEGSIKGSIVKNYNKRITTRELQQENYKYNPHAPQNDVEIAHVKQIWVPHLTLPAGNAEGIA
jgi:hypothetical protein